MTRQMFASLMTALTVAGVLCSFVVPAVQAQSNPSMKQVSLDQGHVTFLVPSNFRSLSAAQIARKFPRGHPPKIVYANQTESISIAVNFMGKVPNLSSAKGAFDKILPQSVPGFHWIKDGYVTINRTTWVDLEFTTPAADSVIHNHTLFTSLAGKSVGLNLNATTQSYAEAAPLLQAVENSLSIKP